MALVRFELLHSGIKGGEHFALDFDWLKAWLEELAI
jgi:hypothetical protein